MGCRRRNPVAALVRLGVPVMIFPGARGWVVFGLACAFILSIAL